MLEYLASAKGLGYSFHSNSAHCANQWEIILNKCICCSQSFWAHWDWDILTVNLSLMEVKFLVHSPLYLDKFVAETKASL